MPKEWLLKHLLQYNHVFFNNIKGRIKGRIKSKYKYIVTLNAF